MGCLAIVISLGVTSCASSNYDEADKRSAFFDLSPSLHSVSPDSHSFAYQVFIDGTACVKIAYAIEKDSDGRIESSKRSRSVCSHHGSPNLTVTRLDISSEQLDSFDRTVLDLGFLQTAETHEARPSGDKSICIDPVSYEFLRSDGERLVRIQSDGCFMSHEFSKLLSEFEVMTGSKLR